MKPILLLILAGSVITNYQLNVCSNPKLWCFSLSDCQRRCFVSFFVLLWQLMSFHRDKNNKPVGLLVLFCPPVGVEPAMLGHHPVPLGVGVDDAQDAGLPGKGIPPGREE